MCMVCGQVGEGGEGMGVPDPASLHGVQMVDGLRKDLCAKSLRRVCTCVCAPELCMTDVSPSVCVRARVCV